MTGVQTCAIPIFDNNLEETTNYIRHVLAVYKAKDEMLKAIMASQNMF